MQAPDLGVTRTAWFRALCTRFAPPKFPGDELNTRRAALVHIVLIGAGLLCLCAFVIVLFDDAYSPFLKPLLLLSFCVCVILHHTMRQGHITLAAWGTVVFCITGTTLGIAFLGTIHTLASASYLAIVVLSAFLLSRRGIYLTAAACALIVLLLMAAENVALLPRYTAATEWTQWLFFTTLLFVVGTLVFSGMRILRDTLARADQELAERKRAETILQDSKERYQRLVASAQDVIYRMSLPDGTYEYVSPAATQMFGYPPEDFYATPRFVARLIHPDWRAYLNAEWQKLLAGEMAPTYEYQIVTRSGSVRWIFQRNVLVRNAQGAPVAIEGIATDITARKRAESVTAARSRLLQESFSRNWNEILQLLLDEAEALTGSCIGFFHFLEQDQKTLVLQSWSGNTSAKFCRAEGEGRHYSIDTAGVWANSARERRPVIYNSYNTLPNRKGMPVGHAVVERFISIPIFRADRIVGIIGVGNAAYDYTAQDVQVVRELADLTWDIVERKRAEAQLQYLSTHDALTGIFNRALFETELDRLENSREYPISIIVTDLDDLKQTNDSRGHAAGDALLKRTAQALGSTFRASDVLARIGGDEFALILPRTDAGAVLQVLARVQANLAVYNADHPTEPLNLSVGIATSERGDLLDMFRRADAAMYAEKRAHKNRTNYFAAESRA